MTGFEKTVWFSLLFLRSALTFLDLAAIAAIGYLATSVATVLSGSGEHGQSFEVAGIALPGVTFDTIPIVAAIILALFISKTLLSIAITGWTTFFIGRIESRAAKRHVRNPPTPIVSCP